MLFILGLELLATKIRSCPNVKGIKLPDLTADRNDNNIILKLAMYADDVKNDFNSVQNIIENFSSIYEQKQNQGNVVRIEKEL